MASPELEAFYALDGMGMILEGEFFSPSKAQESHYTELLEAVEKIRKQPIKRNASSHQNRSQQSALLPDSKALTDAKPDE
tara:strand:- start:225 stop:464 length:240 start_codon:yes stop_codon:yes gene_type:complete